MDKKEVIEQIDGMLRRLNTTKEHLKTLMATGYSDTIIKVNGTLVLIFKDYNILLEFMTDEKFEMSWYSAPKMNFCWKNDDHELWYSCFIEDIPPSLLGGCEVVHNKIEADTYSIVCEC